MKKLDKNAKKAARAYEEFLENITEAKVKVPPARYDNIYIFLELSTIKQMLLDIQWISS